MKNITHNSIADFYIKFSHEHGDYITNLKLQKLVYYAQAWHLGLYSKELFEADFQAWVHGPVCPPLYFRLKQYGWNPITEQPEKIDIQEDVEKHLIEVYEVYGQYTGYQLEQMTHSESPWLDARGGIPIDEASSEIIPKKSMMEFYSKIAREAA